jgi:hypothetical protein
MQHPSAALQLKLPLCGAQLPGNSAAGAKACCKHTVSKFTCLEVHTKSFDVADLHCMQLHVVPQPIPARSPPSNQQAAAAVLSHLLAPFLGASLSESESLSESLSLSESELLPEELLLLLLSSSELLSSSVEVTSSSSPSLSDAAQKRDACMRNSTLESRATATNQQLKPPGQQQATVCDRAAFAASQLLAEPNLAQIGRMYNNQLL